MNLKNFFIFYVGSIIGSFIGVIIYRRPKGLNFISDRSRCEKCGVIIPIYYNIPIFSYIIQKGICKNCGSKISRYIILYEIVGGIAAVYSFLKYGWSFNFIIYSMILYMVLIISFTDIKEYFIYQTDIIMLFIFIFIFKYFNHSISSLNILYGMIFFCIFYIIKKISRAMGDGDIFLSFVVGFNFNNYKDIFFNFQIIFITASIISIILIILKIKTKKDYIAFSPYLLLPLVI